MADSTQFNAEVETIEEFLERFKIQQADALDKAGTNNKKKVSLLVKSLSVQIITDLQRRLKPKSLSEVNYDDLVKQLSQQYTVKKSAVAASVAFLQRRQQPNETIEAYAQDLNNLASACAYQDCCRDRLLRDAFVSGLYSSTVLSALLQKCEDLSFSDCVENAKLIQ